MRVPLHLAGSVVPPLCSDSPQLLLCDPVFADHLSNACFSPSFLFVIWQGDPIPEDIYEILGGSSVRSISDLQRALRIDSVGKSPLHQTLLYFFLNSLGQREGIFCFPAGTLSTHLIVNIGTTQEPKLGYLQT